MISFTCLSHVCRTNGIFHTQRQNQTTYLLYKYPTWAVESAGVKREQRIGNTHLLDACMSLLCLCNTNLHNSGLYCVLMYVLYWRLFFDYCNHMEQCGNRISNMSNIFPMAYRIATKSINQLVNWKEKEAILRCKHDTSRRRIQQPT